VDFLLLLIELFSLGVTVEALRTNIGSKSAISLQRGPVDPKYHLEGVALTNHSSSQQDAQLSQRDRAAGCIIVFAKSRRLELGDNILRTL